MVVLILIKCSTTRLGNYQMKKAVVILINFGYWLIYLLLLLVIFVIADTQIRKTAMFPNFLSLFPLIILCIVPNLISFYSFYFFYFHAFCFREKSSL